MRKLLLMATILLLNIHLATASYVLSTSDYNIYTMESLSVANESTSDYLLFTSPTQASWTYENLTDYNYYGGHISIFTTIALGETNVSEEVVTPAAGGGSPIVEDRGANIPVNLTGQYGNITEVVSFRAGADGKKPVLQSMISSISDVETKSSIFLVAVVIVIIMVIAGFVYISKNGVKRGE